jgi:protein-S-isoprenylcysteine O-methyltransferase Ste14
VNFRLVASRLVLGSIAAVACFTQHAWAETGNVDKLLAGLGYGLLIAGCIGRIWCAVYIAGRKNLDLVDKGPFSITRNPLYFFSFLAFIGAGLSFESLTIAAAFGAAFFATHWRTIHLEERNLHKIFGAVYDEYMKRVPRFFPKPRLYAGSEFVTVNSRVFTRTMLEAGLIPLVYLGAQAIEVGHEQGILPTLLRLY